MYKKLFSFFKKRFSKDESFSIKLDVNFETWSKYFAQVIKPNIPQSWNFAEAKIHVQKWKISRGIIFNEKFIPIALVQILYKSFFGITIIRINQGPLWLLDRPSEQEIYKTIYLIKKSLPGFGVKVISFAPNLENSSDNFRMMQSLWFYKRKQLPWSSATVDLTPSIDDIRKKLRTDWRNKLSIAESNNIEIIISQNENDFRWLYEQHMRHKLEKNFNATPKAILQFLLNNSLPQYNLWIMMTKYKNETIGGYAIIQAQQIGATLINWTNQKGRSLKAGNLLRWTSLNYLKEQGCIFFDQGGIYIYSKDSAAHFKLGISSNIYTLLGEFIGFTCSFF